MYLLPIFFRALRLFPPLKFIGENYVITFSDKLKAYEMGETCRTHGLS